MYAVVDSSTKKISKNYAVIDNVTRKITKIYGVVDGVTRLVWSENGNNYAYTGIIYVGKPYSNVSADHYLAYYLFDKTQTFVTMNSYSSYYSAISKNGYVLISFYTPILRVWIWDSTSKSYVPANAQYTDLTDISSGANQGFGRPYISNDGTIIVVPASSYGLIFFRVNIDKKTVAVFKMSGSSTVDKTRLCPISPSSSASVYDSYHHIWSDNDDHLTLLTSTTDFSTASSSSLIIVYIWNVNLKSGTAQLITAVNGCYFKLSNDGHYVCIYDGDTPYVLYINNNTATKLTADVKMQYVSYRPYSMYVSNNLLIASANTQLNHYQINDDLALTKLGSFSFTNRMSINSIHDLCNNRCLAYYAGYPFGGAFSRGFAIYSISKTSDLITSMNIQRPLMVYNPNTETMGSVPTFQSVRLLNEEKFDSCYQEPQATITSSGTWTVPTGVTSIDIFCVGGGGGAGGSYYNMTTDGDSYSAVTGAGVSGAGGYTNTVTNVSVAPGDVLTITIGSGGTGGACYYKNDGTWNGISKSTDGASGEATSVMSSSGTILCRAYGGNGGLRHATDSVYAKQGASGGSGSGAVGSSGFGSVDSVFISTGADGEDGTNGESVSSIYLSNGVVQGGTGQGSTTRAFGHYLAPLYSTAGAHRKSAPSGNTGNGGNRNVDDKSTLACSGDNGVVLIRY